jgi:hypothetical protein
MLLDHRTYTLYADVTEILHLIYGHKNYFTCSKITTYLFKFIVNPVDPVFRWRSPRPRGPPTPCSTQKVENIFDKWFLLICKYLRCEVIYGNTLFVRLHLWINKKWLLQLTTSNNDNTLTHTYQLTLLFQSAEKKIPLSQQRLFFPADWRLPVLVKIAFLQVLSTSLSTTFL